ncbi:MAG TPA: hypothetical protein PK098_04230 [Phycisphaerales bacterium]|nr:hypothetical protein [Phycisphaerales bacterium]
MARSPRSLLKASAFGAVLAFPIGGVRHALADVVHSTYISNIWYHYSIKNMPDLDQRRSPNQASGIPGLPANGSMYCVPTATMNLFAYAANHGFPGSLPGPGNYQSQNLYNQTTAAIQLMGFFMGTHPIDGTKTNGWKSGALTWNNLGSNTYPLLISFNGLSGTSFRNLNQMAAAASSGAIVTFNYGRWNVVGTNQFGHKLVERSGGHAVTLRYARRQGNVIDVGYRDPANGRANSTQSEFATTYSWVTPMVVDVGSSLFAQLANVHRIDEGSTTTSFRLIESYVAIRPFYGLTFQSATTPIIKKIQPISFQGHQTPPVVQIPTLNNKAMLDLALDPDGNAAIVSLRDLGTNAISLHRVDMLTEEIETITGLQSMKRFVFGRNRDFYGTDGDKLYRLSMDNNWEAVSSASTAGPFNALYYDDATDTLIALNTMFKGIIRYPASLIDNPQIWIVPGHIPMAGDGSVSVNPVDGNVWFVSAASNHAVRVIPPDPNTGGAPFFLLTAIPGVTNPTNIDFDDRGHMFVTFEGKVREFEADANGIWHLVPNALFDSYPVGSRFIVGRSRSFADDADAHDPFFNINPDELFTPPHAIVIDCPADLNDDRVVDVLDLLILLGNWGACGDAPCLNDLTLDRVVDVLDLLTLLGSWGPCPN